MFHSVDGVFCSKIKSALLKKAAPILHSTPEGQLIIIVSLVVSFIFKGHSLHSTPLKSGQGWLSLLDEEDSELEETELEEEELSLELDLLEDEELILEEEELELEEQLTPA